MKSVANFLQKLTKACPALPYMALGIWLIWVFVLNSGTAWLSNTETDGTNVTTLYLTTCGAIGAFLLLSSFLPATLAERLASPLWIGCGAVVSTVGCFLVIVIGPYYLKPYLGDWAVAVLFYLGSFLGGAGSVPLLLKCADMYGRLAPRHVILYTAFSHILAALTYFVVIGAPSWAPVEGGPSLAGIVAFVFFPLVAAFLACLPSVDLGVEATEGNALSAERAARALRTKPFKKLVVVVFAFSLVTSVVRAVAVQASPVEQTYEVTRLAMLMRMAAATVFACVAVAADAKLFNFGKIYSVVMTAAVGVVALLPFVDIFHAVTGSFVLLIAFVFDFLLWCVLSFIVYQSRSDSLWVVGRAYGCSYLGIMAGWVLGARALSPILSTHGNWWGIWLALAFVVLALAFVLFSEKEFDNLFKPVEETGASLESLLEEGIEGATAVGLQEGETGWFERAVEMLVEEHGLTEREREVMRCLAHGYSVSAVAKALQVSRNTARNHCSSIYSKLDVHSKQEVIDKVNDLRQVLRKK